MAPIHMAARAVKRRHPRARTPITLLPPHPCCCLGLILAAPCCCGLGGGAQRVWGGMVGVSREAVWTAGALGGGESPSQSPTSNFNPLQMS